MTTDMRDEDLVAVDPTDDDAVNDFLKSAGANLTAGEFRRVCDLLGRNPTPVELHIFNTMWSEHCSYKSSRATLKQFLPTEAPHVVLGPGEDAGIIRFTEVDGRSVCLVMAHESHNHPSQVLPVEGAATGIGGIVRDVYCMGADVIGVMDPLRFGDPDGPHAGRVRDIAFGVVDGIAQYANALGVPNFGGETTFDASFDDNCLVNVVAVGLVDEDGIIRSRVPDEARDEPYDVILIGKPTDASGFGGAAFASERLSEDEAVERQGAVQVPDPFLKRVLAEAIKCMLAWAKDKDIAIGFKDLGAGGISCAVSEMAQAAGMGVSVDLDAVNVAFDDLPPEVISCSETQERFLLAVPARCSAEAAAIFNEQFDMPHLYAGAGAVVIGRVTPEKRFRVVHCRHTVSDADVDAITTGIAYDRSAGRRGRRLPGAGMWHGEGIDGVREALLALLGSVNISDRSPLFQHYDSEVQARAVLRPGEADAAVALPVPGHAVGLALACGSNSRLGAVDPYLGGVWAVVEAARNVACVGAVPLAITDCLNYGDPEDPAVFHEFVEGVRGIGDACRALTVTPGGHGIPVISGNVSFYNQSQNGEAIAPTPIVACAGRIDEPRHTSGMGLARAGSRLFLLGRIHAQTGGSEYERLYGDGDDAPPPAPDFAAEVGMLQTLVEGFATGGVLAAHDISHGGLLVAVCEMALASRPFDAGADLDLTAVVSADDPLAAQLFSEYGGVVVEVDAAAADAFVALAGRHGAPLVALGSVSDSPQVAVRLPGGRLSVSIDDMARAHRGRMEELLYG